MTQKWVCVAPIITVIFCHMGEEASLFGAFFPQRW